MRKEWILAGFCALIFSCGGGGGGGIGSSGGSSSSGSSSVSLYFTDDASMYSEILVKVYEVNLCSDNVCQQKVSLFTNQQGLQVDLAKLNGVYQYITTTNIPQGTYNRLEVVMDKNLTITDQSGQQHQAIFVPMQEKPNKPNTVQCHTNERCYIRFNGTVQPFAIGKLVVDFDLKEFEVNTSINPWQVTEVKMKPLTPQGVQDKDREVYIKVQSVGTNSFTGTWMGKTYMVYITQNTTCEMNGVKYYGSGCINQITQGMCLEVRVQEDPATSNVLNAVKIESEKKQAKCMM
ncbi:MAG: DUF4382 domain-containing protein [Thermocrinis sp.]|jgi:hypothetical protein|nr:DUF4382 domain-containing protein [Thermocrinis sp.]